jgi:hypothetical protein
MDLRNAILAGEHGGLEERQMGTTLMNSAWASLPGLDIATFGYSGMQRSIGRFAVTACHGEIRRGRPDRMIEPHRGLDRNFCGAG